MPREIINIGQRETGRYNYRDQPEIDLITIYLSYCVAVVFTDVLGNVSLTHFDANTDLAFLWREAAWMKGKFTVDIVKLVPRGDEAADRVLTTLKQKYPDIKNSNGNQDHRRTKHGTILLRNGKLLTPTQEHVEEISPLYSGKKPGQDNPLKNDKLVFVDNDMPKATLAEYERILNQRLDAKEYFPIIVFDRGWTDQSMKLTPTVQRIVADYMAKRLSSADIIKIGRKCVHRSRDSINNFAEMGLVPLLDTYITESCKLAKILEEKKKQAHRKALT